MSDGKRSPRRAPLACRFHGLAWSKTCQECCALLDAGAAPPAHELVLAANAAERHGSAISALLWPPSLLDLLCLAAGVAIGWWFA